VEPDTLREQVLAAARRGFATFYAAASPTDTLVMGALVLARVNLAVLMNQPRAGLAAHLRTELEHTTDIAEQYFTHLREELRVCATFNALSDAEQIKIERTLLDVKSPIPWS
jgi:hypothetical protein